jgi:hypothetical protein
MKSPASKPLSAFSERYLAALRERDEPPSAPDGDVVGPWRVREHGDRFCLFREWESFETGHTPVAEFTNREDALIFATALRAIAGPPAYRVRTSSAPDAGGCEIERDGETVGRFAYRREELLVDRRRSSTRPPPRCAGSSGVSMPSSSVGTAMPRRSSGLAT